MKLEAEGDKLAKAQVETLWNDTRRVLDKAKLGKVDAIIGQKRKLDIEVDGEHYHRHWDGELCMRDQIRSRRLNDLGWDVMRFWVYELRDDLAGSVERVRSWLAR